MYFSGMKEGVIFGYTADAYSKHGILYTDGTFQLVNPPDDVTYNNLEIVDYENGIALCSIMSSQGDHYFGGTYDGTMLSLIEPTDATCTELYLFKMKNLKLVGYTTDYDYNFSMPIIIENGEQYIMTDNNYILWDILGIAEGGYDWFATSIKGT